VEQIYADTSLANEELGWKAQLNLDDMTSSAWNWEKNLYEYINMERKNLQPELWHSIIAPHTGNMDQDVTKIRDFFARVYQYDAKQ
jgi:hypothetical protein